MTQSPSLVTPIPRRRFLRRHRWIWGLALAGGAFLATSLWPTAARWQARRALEARRFEAAGSWIALAERSWWKEPETTLLKARWKRRQGDVVEAGALLVQALEEGASRHAIEREQWMALAQVGRMTEAEPHLPELLRDPGNDVVEICEAYASGYVFLRRYGDALKLLDAWLLDDPHSAYARVLRGRIRHDRGQSKLAEDDFRKAIELDPACGEARMVLGRILQHSNRHADALEQFEQCRTDPKWANEAQLAQAISLRVLGDDDKAVAVLKQVLKTNPDCHEAAYELGRLERERGSADEAVKLLRSAIAANPGNSDYRYALAQALQDQQQFDEAKVLLKEVEHTLALRNRAQVLADQAESNPRNVQLRLELGTICFELGRPEEAIGWLQSVIELDARNVSAHRALAKYYRKHEDARPGFRPLGDHHDSIVRRLENGNDEAIPELPAATKK